MMSSDEGSIANIYISDEEPINIIGDDNNIEETEEVQRDSERDEDNQNETQNETREVVKPKKVVRNPQPKLNAETLKGPRGIAAIEHYFERVKFKGKGYEVQDLNAIMKTYEYWCHRLFPKFPFETCIERLEKLGTKKAVQTHIKRIRYNLLVEDEPVLNNSDDEPITDGFVNMPEDEINYQNQQFDQLLPSTADSPSVSVELTEEQKERIRLNREKAEKIRLEKLRTINEKGKKMLGKASSSSSNEVDKEILCISENIEDEMQDIDDLLEDMNEDKEETFDYESNFKGKSNIRGVAHKKKSPQSDDEDGETGLSKESPPTQKKHKKKGVITSDSEEDESYTNNEKIQTSVNGVVNSKQNFDDFAATSRSSPINGDLIINVNEEKSDDEL